MNVSKLVLLATLLPLAACASMPTPQQQAQRAARVEAAAGAPVNHIQLLFRGFYAWEPLNDHQMIAYVTPKKAYLLDLPPCPGLAQSPAIGITSRMQQVSVNFDSVTTGNVGVPCPIRQIRPIDLNQLKQDKMVQKKDIKVQARPSTRPVDGNA